MSATQLNLIVPDAHVPMWASEGARCKRCADGHMHLVVPSDPCACQDAPCSCLAEGYAKCDACGALRQVFPREMRRTWHVAEPDAAR